MSEATAELTEAKAAFLRADRDWTIATVLSELAEAAGADPETMAAIGKLMADKEALMWKTVPAVPPEHRASSPDVLKPIADAIVAAFCRRAGLVKVDIHISSVVPMGKDKDGVLHCDYGMTRVTEAVPCFTTPGPAGAPVPLPTKFNLRVNHV